MDDTKIRYKAITTHLLMSDNGKILIEKREDGPHFLVLFHHAYLKEPKVRLFQQESDADDFVNYLTENEL